MSRIVISSITDSSAWDDDNSVTINAAWNMVSANPWNYVSGNMSLLGSNGGTGQAPATAVPPSFMNRSGGLAFGLAKSGSFSMGNAFAALPVGTQGMVMGGASDGDNWTPTAR